MEAMPQLNANAGGSSRTFQGSWEYTLNKWGVALSANAQGMTTVPVSP